MGLSFFKYAHVDRDKDRDKDTDRETEKIREEILTFLSCYFNNKKSDYYNCFLNDPRVRLATTYRTINLSKSSYTSIRIKRNIFEY